ncbi:MAG TPA: hypothetical protein VNH83_06285, partial [Bryobacteraceae bacterium]|nr:hypothetical protein [Bryobacteraceae bacterium]
MLRNFMKSRISDVWRISGEVVDRAVGLASGPLRSAVGVAPTGIRQALSAIGSGAVVAMKTSMRVSESLQRRTVDLAFDAAELQPFTQALAEAGSPVCVSHNEWSQHQAQLDYLKAVNDVGPTDVTLNTILLAVAYSSVGRSEEGVATFEGYLEKFKDQATHRQRAIYLSCLALLRASAAQSAPAWELITTIRGIEKLRAELAEAVELTANEPDYAPGHFKIFPRWVSGMLMANLPWPFGDQEAGLDNLAWCESAITASLKAYVGSSPFLVEIYYNLAALNRAAGNNNLAAAYLAKSGLVWDRPQIQFV